jgi:hypothetical protein
MDQITLVDRRIDDGQRLIQQLVQDGFPVTAAFWLRASEESWWHLYIASKVVDDAGPAKAYRTVQTSLQKLVGTTMSLDDVKVIGASKPITRDVMKIAKRYSGRVPLRFGGAQLGNVSVEEALIYPPLPREKRVPISLGKRKLKTAVQQTSSMDEMLAPLAPEESRAQELIVASGISPVQADYWVRKRREQERARPPIPAGTVVEAEVVAWWGDHARDDPNPLLRVMAPDGAQGLTFLENTDSV